MGTLLEKFFDSNQFNSKSCIQYPLLTSTGVGVGDEPNMKTTQTLKLIIF